MKNKKIRYSLAEKKRLRQFLMSDKGFIPIEDAIKKANKKWSAK